MKILIIESKRRSVDYLLKLMKKNLFSAYACFDEESGYYDSLSGTYDVIIIGAQTNTINEYDLVSKLRKNNINTPILIISPVSDSKNEIRGLECGADYYVTSPCTDDVLIARIKAIARRRSCPLQDEIVQFGDIILHSQNGILHCITSGENTRLTKKEMDLAYLLIKANGNVVSREQILNRICSNEEKTSYNSPEVYIHYLRKDLLKISSKVCIKTFKLFGYSLESSGL